VAPARSAAPRPLHWGRAHRRGAPRRRHLYEGVCHRAPKAPRSPPSRDAGSLLAARAIRSKLLISCENLLFQSEAARRRPGPNALCGANPTQTALSACRVDLATPAGSLAKRKRGKLALAL
jgi:hypothetical protein